MVDMNNISSQGLTQLGQTLSKANGQKATEGDFKNMLMDSINEVNRLQDDAEKATNNLATGKTDNVAEVFTAVKKAELAFQTLMQMRNKLMDAYDEIKQMRV